MLSVMAPKYNTQKSFIKWGFQLISKTIADLLIHNFSVFLFPIEAHSYKYFYTRNLQHGIVTYPCLLSPTWAAQAGLFSKQPSLLQHAYIKDVKIFERFGPRSKEMEKQRNRSQGTNMEEETIVPLPHFAKWLSHHQKYRQILSFFHHFLRLVDN